MKASEVARRLKKEGWIRRKKSKEHDIYEHPILPGRAPVPRHHSKDVSIGVLKSIAKLAGWEDV